MNANTYSFKEDADNGSQRAYRNNKISSEKHDTGGKERTETQGPKDGGSRSVHSDGGFGLWNGGKSGEVDPSFGNEPVRNWANEGIVSPKAGSVSDTVQKEAIEYGIPSFVVSDSVWNKNKGSLPAFSTNGQIYIRETQNERVRKMIIPHEITHVMYQMNYKPYLDFAERTPNFIKMSNLKTDVFFKAVAKHIGYELENITAEKISYLYDELNATIYGSIASNDTYGLSIIRDIFYDFDGYAKELSEIHNQFKSERIEMKNRVDQSNPLNKGGKYSINPEFNRQIDEWDGKSNTIFKVGTTSEALNSIGIVDRGIIWHGIKVAKILRDHDGMTREIIKQVPEILEHPVIVLKSQNSESRIAVFGEITDANGAPVTAILELQPTNRGGQLLNMNVIASAYGKDSNPAGFIQKSDLLYLDTNKKRTDKWLSAVGLQLPSVAHIQYGSIGSITYQDGTVKIVGTPYEQYMQNGGENTATEGGKARYSINPEFVSDVQKWYKEGQNSGDDFTLGSTGPVLQGLGAIESDIYMTGDKISKIMRDHPEMTIKEIQRIPEILEDPVIILKSLNKERNNSQNSRLIVFGAIMATDGRPVMCIMDLHPTENGFLLDDMQKVSSAYTKDNSPTEFISGSEVLHLDKKRAVPLLRTIGFHMPITLQRSGSIGSITYRGPRVNILGQKFSDVVDTSFTSNPTENVNGIGYFRRCS